jgi:hypothetical protein
MRLTINLGAGRGIEVIAEETKLAWHNDERGMRIAKSTTYTTIIN